MPSWPHPECTSGSFPRLAGRRFNPHEIYGDDVDLEKIQPQRLDDCDARSFIHIGCHRIRPCEDCGYYAAHTNTLIIAVDGACCNNGYAGANSSLGVFVAPDSPYNVSLMLPSTKTNQVAEIQAGIQGLRVATLLKTSFPAEVGGLQHVVIKADSEYFVKGMTEWILTWERNGYKNTKGQPVMNQEFFREAMSLVKDLERRGTKVQFWHVCREMNQDADRLANLALDSL